MCKPAIIGNVVKRIRVLIETNEPALIAKVLQYQARMSASAKGNIGIHPVGVNIQQFNASM